MRRETPASVPILLLEPASGFHARRRRSELVLWTNDTGSTRQQDFVYPEHEILIFLYFKMTLP